MHIVARFVSERRSLSSQPWLSRLDGGVIWPSEIIGEHEVHANMCELREIPCAFPGKAALHH